MSIFPSIKKYLSPAHEFNKSNNSRSSKGNFTPSFMKRFQKLVESRGLYVQDASPMPTTLIAYRISGILPPRPGVPGDQKVAIVIMGNDAITEEAAAKFHRTKYDLTAEKMNLH